MGDSGKKKEENRENKVHDCKAWLGPSVSICSFGQRSCLGPGDVSSSCVTRGQASHEDSGITSRLCASIGWAPWTSARVFAGEVYETGCCSVSRVHGRLLIGLLALDHPQRSQIGTLYLCTLVPLYSTLRLEPRTAVSLVRHYGDVPWLGRWRCGTGEKRAHTS